MSIHSPVRAQDLLNFGQRLAHTTQLTSSRIQKTLDQQGLTQPQLNLLTHLARWPQTAPALHVTELADAVNITQPAATKMLVKFDALGLVTLGGSDEDKRVKEVRITAAGSMLAQDLQKELASEAQRWLSDWDAEDVAQFTLLLERLGIWLERNPQP